LRGECLGSPLPAGKITEGKAASEAFFTACYGE